MKLMRFLRDMPKHERNSDYLSQLEAEVNPNYGEEEGEEADIRRDRLEDLFYRGANGTEALQEAASYEPVMYKLVKDLDTA